ncbi:MAG: ATP-dependent helicase [Candidatus Omnitrophica bacterium]|nr:ATP-dependent helicase [Candidatus Omnitrophota bacterium]
MEKLSHLNESQWQAVCHEGSHLLITAGPGTGKTHTLTHRIAHLAPTLKSGENILAITFTNKAAGQMKDRLAALGVSPSHVFTGTFHAFCLKLLRDHFEHTALPKDFKVAAPEDIGGFDKETLERISRMKSSQLALAPDEDFKNYQRCLRQNNLIDFDDILREALLLLEDEDIAARLRRRYRHIFVDEYQDSNIVQNALLKILARDGVQLTAIGDANQSIYGFRGSRVDLFRRFQEDFTPAKILTLQENYRSASGLLAASGQIMGGVELLARLETQGKLVIHQAATDRAEADYVAHQIEKLIGGLDMNTSRRAVRSLGDIAVLYRLNAQRHALSQALEHLGIPFQVSQKPKKPEKYCDEHALGRNEEELEFNVEKVSLMSLHAAKGLEFPVVFITGCESNLLPLDLMEMKGEAQEERRLFYVGMTRAREHLYLTHARRRQLFGRTLAQEPCPYLADISEELKAIDAARRQTLKKDPDSLQMKFF